MAKRIVVLCDGTWSKVDQKVPTNIVRLRDLIPDRGADGVEQRVHYVAGVGAGGALVTRVLGGAFGWGLSANVRDGYRFVMENYEPGDQVYLFGYSRGAYTARSLAGFMRNCGVLTGEHAGRLDEAYGIYRDREPSTAPGQDEPTRFRRAHSHPDFGVRFIGVFDTVGALGLPASSSRLLRRINRRWSFHDTELSRTVVAASHALAIDDRRSTFAPTLWAVPDDAPGQTVAQVWFAGGHSNVGGGHPDRRLSDVTLGWMMREAERQDLGFASASPPPATAGDIGHGRVGVFTLWRRVDRMIGRKDRGRETLASTARARYDGDATYRPPALGSAIDAGIPEARI